MDANIIHLDAQEVLRMAKEAFIVWLESVASGEATMSQRNFKWVETNGGLTKLVHAAKARGVHLLQLTDDKDNELIAASTKPFVALC